MHLRVDPVHVFGVFVMSLRGKYHVTSKFGIAEDGLDAWQNIPIVELDAFAFDDKFLGLERRAPRQLVVDNAIQLICCLIRETKSLDDLGWCVSKSSVPDMDHIPLGLRVALSSLTRLAHVSSPNTQSPNQVWSQMEPKLSY